MFPRLSSLAVLGLLALTAGATQAQTLPLQHTNFGMLTHSDPYDRIRVGSHHKVYVGHLQAGKSYVFEMKSSQFDPLLRIEKMNGTQVAYDDDSGVGLNAKLKFTPKFSGDYRIVTTSFKSDATGGFLLTYHAVGGPVGTPWLQPGSNLSTLTALDPFDNLRPMARQKTFLLNATTGNTYILDMESKQFDTFLRIENQFGKVLATDDDSGKGLNSRIVFQPQVNGFYRVVATSFAPEKTGAFNLKLHVVPTLPTVQFFHGKLTLTDTVDVAGRFFDLHPVMLVAGKTYTIKMSSNGFDTVLKVRNGAGQVIAANDDAGGSLNSQVTLTPVQSGTFYLVATSFAPGKTGHYHLTVIGQ